MPAAEREAHLRAMKDRVDDPRQLLHMTIPEIAMLPQCPRAYTRQRFAEISALERHGVTVEGFVARLRQMTDGDYQTFSSRRRGRASALTATPPSNSSRS
jgi:hypothetical protein